MNEIVELLEQRKKQLYQWKNEKEIALRTVPEGFLRISSYGDKVQYYFRNNPKDYNGVYIKEKDISLAQKLAQKDYDTKVLQAVDKELKLIERFQRNYQDMGAEQIYSGMHEERQKLIHPIIESDEEYVKKWMMWNIQEIRFGKMCRNYSLQKEKGCVPNQK